MFWKIGKNINEILKKKHFEEKMPCILLTIGCAIFALKKALWGGVQNFAFWPSLEGFRKKAGRRHFGICVGG